MVTFGVSNFFFFFFLVLVGIDFGGSIRVGCLGSILYKEFNHILIIVTVPFITKICNSN